MRWRPYTWLSLGVFLLVALALLWRLSREQPADNAGTAATQTPSTASTAISNTGSLTPSSAPGQGGTPGAGVASSSVGPTNRFPYRLTNTAKTIGQLTHTDTAILLENALMDTA